MCKLAFLLLLPLSLTVQAQRYFVKQDAPGQNTGQSWADAFTNLHDALALALPGTQIWVAEGTYKPSDNGDRGVYFRLGNGVQLYGGFAGTEMLLEERRWEEHPSILSGDLGVPDNATDNTYNLLYIAEADSNTMVDGFIFRDANADKPNLDYFQLGANGAALFLDGDNGICYPTICRCRFERNSARFLGGAVCNRVGPDGSVAPVFRDCVFIGNSALGGGAIYRDGGSWVDRPRDFWNCRFERNHAYIVGGALYYRDSERTDTLDFYQCLFDGNSAAQKADAISFAEVRAGLSALHVFGSTFRNHINTPSTILLNTIFDKGNLDMIFDSCIFENNKDIFFELEGRLSVSIKRCSFTKYDKGGIALADNTFLTTEEGKLLVQQTKFTDNSSISLNSFYLKTVFDGLIVRDNQDLDIKNGGLVHAVLKNSFFLNNKFEGPLYLSYKKGDGGPKITNCTFIDNVRTRGGTSPRKWRFENSILYQSPNLNGDYLFDKDDTLCFQNSLIYLNPDILNAYLSRCPSGPGNLFNIDPLFANTAMGDYRLQSCSPAVNAGDNALAVAAGLWYDLDGTARIQGGRVDLGPYENSNVLTAAGLTTQPACLNEQNGAIEIKATGGCPPYGVRWSNGTQIDTFLTGLAPGIYGLTITDAKGHAITAQADVPLSNPQLHFSGDSLLCPGASDAALGTTVSGAFVLPLSFVWSEGSTTAQLSGLGPGRYETTVTDAFGCRDSAVVSVVTTAPPILDSVITPASGPGKRDGAVGLIIQGGLPPFTFLWNNADTFSRITNLASGTYSLTLTDREGCAYIYAYEVPIVLANYSPSTVPDGEVLPNPSSGKTLVRFQHSDEWRLFYPSGVPAYVLSNHIDAVITQTDLSNLPPGIYTYTFLKGGVPGKWGKLVLAKP